MWCRGAAASFSLDSAEGVRFHTRSRVFDATQMCELRAAGRI